jgi:long-chain fatty acid transport protein
MKAMNRAILSLAAAGGLMAATALPALAGAFSLREQSAEGQGMSFAGMAAGGGGLSSMFWNPATMTDFPGITSSFVGSAILPGGFISPTAPTPTIFFGRSDTDLIGAGFAPAGYGAYQFTDQFWLGVAVNAPFGLRSRPGFHWAGQVYGQSARVFSANISPSVAYKVNDWISVAVGLQVEYFKTRLSQALGVLPTSPNAVLEGDDTGVGFTAGATLKPTAWTEIGAGFRSMVHESVGGSLTTPLGALPVKANINLPEQATLGVRQVLNAEWSVLAGFEWTHWSRLGIVPVSFGGIAVSNVPFKYNDGYFASVGVEYAWNDALTLRTGLGYEWSPIDTGNRQVLLPDADRLWASIGMTYHFSNKLSFDAGYSHGFVTSEKVQIVPGHPQFPAVGLPFFADVRHPHFDIFSAALTYRWDDTTQAIPVAPIIRKY